MLLDTCISSSEMANNPVWAANLWELDNIVNTQDYV